MSTARRSDGRAWRRVLRGSRTSRIVVRVAIPVAILVLAVGLASLALDEPVRRSMEREVNRRLTGYSVSIGRLDLQLYRLALDLRGVTIRQTSNPEPAVAELPRLHASVEWKALLSLHLVADFLFERPRLHVDLRQARSEIASPGKLKDKGWQEAALAIFPLKINSVRVRDGHVTYIDRDPKRPLELSRLALVAENIRNVRSKRHTYPSPLRAEATVFDSGDAKVEGHADFLAEPFPGIHVKYALRDVPLEALTPVTQRANLIVRGGVLSTTGEIEYAPAAKIAKVDDVTVGKLHLTYVAGVDLAASEPGGGGPSEKPSPKKPEKPGVEGRDTLALKIGNLRLADSDFVFENRGTDPPYKLAVDGLEAELTGYGSMSADRPSVAHLRGRFLGSGPARAKLVLRPNGEQGPDFDLTTAIGDTDMRRMNDLLRAYGNFDVTSGVFTLYSELHVENGQLSGYVKPLFRDVQVYDPRQDRRKNIFRKAYEGLVGVVAKILENRQRDEVATVAQLSGRVGDTKSNTLQAIGGLIQNAFFKAILPGFERQAIGPGKRPPAKKE